MIFNSRQTAVMIHKLAKDPDRDGVAACRSAWRQVLPCVVSLLSSTGRGGGGGPVDRRLQRAVCALLRVASYGAHNADNKVRPTHATHTVAAQPLARLCPNRCVARVCCKSDRHWLTAVVPATAHRWVQMGVASAVETPDSCCVSDAFRR